MRAGADISAEIDSAKSPERTTDISVEEIAAGLRQQLDLRAMTTIVPRWEWRSFGERFGAAEAVLAALAPERVHESDELYLLSPRERRVGEGPRRADGRQAARATSTPTGSSSGGR